MAPDTTRRLILLRHAKSDWPDVPDQDRPLAKRGRRDAPRIGRWLHEHGYQPDVAVVSAATRTRQTWDLVAPELGGSPAVRFEPRAYAASALTLLYLAQELPERYRTALLIGHNPGLSELATSLAAPAPEWCRRRPGNGRPSAPAVPAPSPPASPAATACARDQPPHRRRRHLRVPRRLAHPHPRPRPPHQPHHPRRPVAREPVNATL